MENFKYEYAKWNREALRAEIEFLDGLLERLVELKGEDLPECDIILEKYNYILELIGDYSEVRFYIRGDESGELIIKSFETANHHKRWVEGMGDAIEIFSENIY